MASRVARSLADAESLAYERGVALTPLRRRVLEMILEANRPLGAYALLAGLKTKTGRAMPPTVYRALAFLIEQGFELCPFFLESKPVDQIQEAIGIELVTGQ